MLGTLAEYPVAKEICIATDKPSRLAIEIGRWEIPDVGICRNVTELAGLDQSTAQLTSVHRHHLYNALRTGKRHSQLMMPKMPLFMFQEHHPKEPSMKHHMYTEHFKHLCLFQSIC